MNRFSITVAVVTLVSCLAGNRVMANVITVPGNASGFFGAPVSGSTDFVLGFTFTSGGQSVEITASGTVFTVSPGFPTDPDGLTMQRSFIMGSPPQAYTPLEEALVDAGIPPPISVPSSIVTNIAALIGAFVPETVASQPSVRSNFD